MTIEVVHDSHEGYIYVSHDKIIGKLPNQLFYKDLFLNGWTKFRLEDDGQTFHIVEPGYKKTLWQSRDLDAKMSVENKNIFIDCNEGGK